ncbi:MAG: hypothetical protein AAF405_07990, partial [Pseudomonadota bacterium]
MDRRTSFKRIVEHLL